MNEVSGEPYTWHIWGAQCSVNETRRPLGGCGFDAVACPSTPEPKPVRASGL